MPTRNYRLYTAVTLTLLAAPAITTAQVAAKPADTQEQGVPAPRLYFNPRMGLFMPFGSLVADRTIKLDHIASLAFGTRVGYQVAPRLTLETSLTWSPAQVARRNWNSVVDLAGGIGAASAEARWLVLQSVKGLGDEYALHAGGGVAVIGRWGDAWGDLVTTPAAVMSGMVRYRPHHSRISYTGEVQHFMSRTPYRRAHGTTHQGLLHHDFIFTLGAAIPLASAHRSKGN
jgi:hypothetical protein